MYIQSLDALKASALTGTEGASWPFWSPDSRSLGFFAHGQLKRIDAEGGSPIDICEARVPCRGAPPWTPPPGPSAPEKPENPENPDDPENPAGPDTPVAGSA